MKNDDFGKKVASMLNELPLEKRIEDRLAQARKIAISRSKNKEIVVDVNSENTSVVSLKSSIFQFNDNLKWFIFLAIGILFVFLQQTVMNNNDSGLESAEYLSNDYIQYKNKLDSEHESFNSWKLEVSNLIENEQQN